MPRPTRRSSGARKAAAPQDASIASDAPKGKRQKTGGGSAAAAAQSSGSDDDNTLQILVATDNHLGFAEDDPMRKDDSFEAFEEVFKIATERNVDLVLLGGDIFHHNKPSKRTVCKTIEILRRYCLNNKKLTFKVLNTKEDSKDVFSTAFGSTNYEDPNFHVGLPTFTIHGNHDDPAGVDQVSAIDMLSSSNLLNYFGKSKIEGKGTGQIKIRPVLLGKGSTMVAIFGLGWIRDERLAKLFRVPEGISWCHPTSDDGYDEDAFFNIFVVHQNRAQHNPRNCVDESLFSHHLDLVIWGHEHESLPNPTQSEGGKKYLISQPGSTVHTALTEGEAKQKHCMLLKIQEKQWKAEPIPLATVRPFIFDKLVLKDELHTYEGDVAFEDKTEEITDILAGRVESLLASLAAHPDASVKNKVPLIRIKVDYSGFTTINSQRFGQRFVGRVANPNDILLFTKAARRRGAGGAEGANGGTSRGGRALPDFAEQQHIDAFICEHMAEDLSVFTMKDLNSALHDFVDKDETKAFHHYVYGALGKAMRGRKQGAGEGGGGGGGGGEAPAGGGRGDDDDDFMDDLAPDLKPTKAAPKKRAPPKRAPPPKKKAPARGRSKKATVVSSEDDDDDSFELSDSEGEGAGGGGKARGGGGATFPRPSAGTRQTPRRAAARKAAQSVDVMATLAADSEDEVEDLPLPGPARPQPTQGTQGTRSLPKSWFTSNAKKKKK